MTCPNGHEHDKLICPVCATGRSINLFGDRMVAAIKSGSRPTRFAGHWTLHPDSWRRVAREFGARLTETKFPTLCGGEHYSATKIGSIEKKPLDNCAACDAALVKITHEL